jgi:hypothetical protein
MKNLYTLMSAILIAAVISFILTRGQQDKWDRQLDSIRIEQADSLARLLLSDLGYDLQQNSRIRNVLSRGVEADYSAGLHIAGSWDFTPSDGETKSSIAAAIQPHFSRVSALQDARGRYWTVEHTVVLDSEKNQGVVTADIKYFGKE